MNQPLRNPYFAKNTPTLRQKSPVIPLSWPIPRGSPPKSRSHSSSLPRCNIKKFAIFPRPEACSRQFPSENPKIVPIPGSETKIPPQGSCGKGFPQLPVIFSPLGKVKYFLRKCEILLTQCEICFASCGIALRLIKKPYFLRNLGVPSFFQRKYFNGRADFTRCKAYFTDLHCKSISLLVGHIPIPHQLTVVCLSP